MLSNASFRVYIITNNAFNFLLYSFYTRYITFFFIKKKEHGYKQATHFLKNP